MEEKTLTWKNGSVVPYTEELDGDGYVYEVFIEYDDRPAMVYIIECGCHIEWEDTPGITDTNITPEKIFGKLPRLEEKHLKHILSILCRTGFEGKVYDGEFMEDLYQEWLRRGQP